MAQLDRFLNLLVSNNATALVMSEGEVATLTIKDSARPGNEAAAHELADPHAAARDFANERASFARRAGFCSLRLYVGGRSLRRHDDPERQDCRADCAEGWRHCGGSISSSLTVGDSSAFAGRGTRTDCGTSTGRAAKGRGNSGFRHRESRARQDRDAVAHPGRLQGVRSPPSRRLAANGTRQRRDRADRQ